LPLFRHLPHRSWLQSSALDRLIPVALVVAALWVLVGWATGQW